MDKIDYSGSLADTDVSKCIDQYPRIMMVIHRRSVRQVLYQDSQCLLVYWSHRSNWHRAYTKWGPPNFIHLALYILAITLISVFKILYFIEYTYQ